jgi:hypothetical protein
MRLLTRIILLTILILSLGSTARGQTPTTSDIPDASPADQRMVILETFMRPG